MSIIGLEEVSTDGRSEFRLVEYGQYLELCYQAGRFAAKPDRGSSCGSGEPPSLPLRLHALELAVEGLAFDPQDLRGLALVAAGGGEHFANVLLFRVGQGVDGLIARFHDGESVADRVLVDAVGQNDHPLDHVLQLPYVAGPRLVL